MKTIKYKIISLVLGTILLGSVVMAGTGCSNYNDSDGSQQASTTVTDETSAQTETTVEETRPLTPEEEMLSRTTVAGSNNSRVQAVLEKIKNGDQVTLGFIGGSITEGYNAGTEDIFAKLVTQYLNDHYSQTGDNVTYVNAGLSGTPSMLGLIRANRDMLYAQPDMVFIEFAVNDAQTFTDKQAYESLIRECLEMENDPAVLLLFSVTEEGYTCQSEMSQTGFYYSLPMVSVNNVIGPEIEAGNMVWSDWANDSAHPNQSGHELYTKMITYTIDQLASEPKDEDYEIPAKLKYGTDWTNMQLYDRTNLEDVQSGAFEDSQVLPAFSNTYSKKNVSEEAIAENTNEPFCFSFTGETLFLVYKCTTSETYGTAEVKVDGQVVAHVNACSTDGWNNPVPILVYNDAAGEHDVEIYMQAGDEGKAFDILAFGICSSDAK